MTCDQALELISAKLDKELSPKEEAALQAHLERCPACRSVLQELTDAQNGLLELQAEPPETLVPSVMKKIRRAREGRAERRRFFLSAAVLVSAAAVVAVLAGTGLIRLPGFDRTMPASAAIGELLPSEGTNAEAELAKQLAEEKDCAVLVVKANGAALPELKELTGQTLEDGAVLYVTNYRTLRAVEEAYREVLPLAGYEPAGPYSTDDSAAACVLLAPA